jgi:hypothetical protein
MIKVAFIGNWGESPETLLKRYSAQTPGNTGVWQNIVGVPNIKDADYNIIMEQSSLDLPQDNTIVIKREPNYISSHVPNYKHVVSWDDTNCGSTWWINKSYDELKAMDYPTKNNKISCVASSKHSHRSDYLKSLFVKSSPIHLYGRGHDKSYYGDNYKGSLEYDGSCKFLGIADYEYSIAMENSQQKNYFTEKLADVYLSWTVPIYWGAPNLKEYFPNKSFYMIDIDSSNPIEQINEIINTPVDIDALKKARSVILDKTNIWEVVNKKIKDINL